MGIPLPFLLYIDESLYLTPGAISLSCSVWTQSNTILKIFRVVKKIVYCKHVKSDFILLIELLHSAYGLVLETYLLTKQTLLLTHVSEITTF